MGTSKTEFDHIFNVSKQSRAIEHLTDQPYTLLVPFDDIGFDHNEQLAELRRVFSRLEQWLSTYIFGYLLDTNFGFGIICTLLD